MADYLVDTDGGQTYSSMSAAEAALPATWTEDHAIICEASSGSADQSSGGVEFTGYTDNGYRLTVRAATGQEAGTEWDSNVYRFEYTNNAGNGLQFNLPQFTLENLQISGSLNNRANESWSGSIVYHYSASTSGSVNHVKGNHLRVVGTLLADNTGAYHDGILMVPGEIFASVTPIYNIYNNILSWETSGAYSWTNSRGIRVEHRDFTSNYYNNTVIGFPTGLSSAQNGSERITYAKNNLINDCDTATQGLDSSATYSDYNATDLASLGYTANSNDRVSQTFTFESASDFALASTDAGARNYGLSDPGSGLFSDDILGNTRSGSWDIGAHEYVSAVVAGQPLLPFLQTKQMQHLLAR